jgi:hypothetical protein
MKHFAQNESRAALTRVAGGEPALHSWVATSDWGARAVWASDPERARWGAGGFYGDLPARNSLRQALTYELDHIA